MDVFKEQIVTRWPNRNDSVTKLLTIISGVALAMCVVLFSITTPFAMFGFLFAGFIVFGAYQLISRMEVEYEYILTNNEIDIDKIIAQKNRKRLCTLQISTATDFGVADENADFGDVTNVIATANNPEVENYFIRFKHKSLGDTVVTFSPDEEMVALIKQFLPRELKKSLSK